MKERELLRRIASGATENIRFADLVALLLALGFEETRTNGSHRVFRHRETGRHVNVQPRGGDAKAYQVRQIQRMVEQYDFQLEDDR